MIQVHVFRKGQEVTDIPVAMAGRAPGADAAIVAAVSATGLWVYFKRKDWL
jgi:hypothetical protein